MLLSTLNSITGRRIWELMFTNLGLYFPIYHSVLQTMASDSFVHIKPPSLLQIHASIFNGSLMESFEYTLAMVDMKIRIRKKFNINLIFTNMGTWIHWYIKINNISSNVIVQCPSAVNENSVTWTISFYVKKESWPRSYYSWIKIQLTQPVLITNEFVSSIPVSMEMGIRYNIMSNI